MAPTGPEGAPVDERERHLPDLLGIELEHTSAHSVVARLTVRPELLAPNGYLHAATVIALADTACGYGTLAGIADAGAVFTTLEAKANFLATSRHGTLVCRATRRHGGATTQVWDAEVSCEGRALALFRCTQLILGPRPTQPQIAAADVGAGRPSVDNGAGWSQPADRRDTGETDVVGRKTTTREG